jgi:hypothetical protein
MTPALIAKYRHQAGLALGMSPLNLDVLLLPAAEDEKDVLKRYGYFGITVRQPGENVRGILFTGDETPSPEGLARMAAEAPANAIAQGREHSERPAGAEGYTS